MQPIDPQSVSNSMTSTLLGCSANTLSTLAGRGILPREGRGRYNLYKVIPSYVAHLKGEHAKTRKEYKGKERLLSENLRKMRLANNRAAARLIETDKVWTIYREVYAVLYEMVAEAIVRDADLILALSKSSSPKELRRMLDNRIAEVMRAIEEALDLGENND